MGYRVHEATVRRSVSQGHGKRPRACRTLGRHGHCRNGAIHRRKWCCGLGLADPSVPQKVGVGLHRLAWRFWGRERGNFYGRGMNKSGIYAIISKSSGRLYVGSAANLSNRWAVHRHGLVRGIHHNKQLQRAWKKYGESAFDFVVLDIVSDGPLLIPREQFWLDCCKAIGLSIYNHCQVAGNTAGRKFSAETLARMSATRKGRKHSEESRRRMSEARKGVPMPRRFSHSSWNAGLKMSDEQRAKLSEMAKASRRNRARDKNGRYCNRGGQ